MNRSIRERAKKHVKSFLSHSDPMNIVQRIDLRSFEDFFLCYYCRSTTNSHLNWERRRRITHFRVLRVYRGESSKRIFLSNDCLKLNKERKAIVLFFLCLTQQKRIHSIWSKDSRRVSNILSFNDDVFELKTNYLFFHVVLVSNIIQRRRKKYVLTEVVLRFRRTKDFSSRLLFCQY